MKKLFLIKNEANYIKWDNVAYSKELIGKKECYFSYFLYDNELANYLTKEGMKSLTGVRGRVYADYLILNFQCKDKDGKLDLEKALFSLKVFLAGLIKEYSLTKEQILINFDGDEGFHIRIHSSLFGGFTCNSLLPFVHKEIATRLTLSSDFFDYSIYQIDHFVRIPETINKNYNFRAIFIPTNKILDLNSIVDLNDLFISDYDKRKNNYPIINSFFDGDISFPPCEKLVELKNEVYEKIQNNQALRLIDSKNDFDLPGLLSEYPKLKLIADNCSITNDILNKAKSGTHLSNKERIIISSLLVNLHPENDNLVHSIMKNQNNYNPDITSAKYEHIKSLNYSPYNCNSMCETKLCSNAKKSKAKSPLFFANTTTKFNQSIFVEEFISYYRGQLLYDHKQEIFYFYSNGYFKKYSENQLSSLINSFLKNQSYKKEVTDRDVKGIVNRLKMEDSIHMEGGFNQYKFLFNLKNGVFDPLTKTIYPHDPKYRFSYQFNVEYDPNAKCRLYEETLNQIFNSDQEIINFFLRWQCYLFVYDYSYQKMLILYGKGRNGKSLLLNITRSLLGNENVSSERLQDLANDRGYALVNLMNKFLNISQELSGGEIEVDTIKQITGGDLISARPIYKERVKFINNARLIIATNILPRISNFDQAFYQRIDFIEFPNSFADNPDTNLEIKLKNELPGIFNLIISQFAHIRKEDNSINIEVPEKSRESLHSNLASFNSVLEWVSECCLITISEGNHKVLSLKEAYSHYDRWCSESGGKKMSKNKFKKILEDHYHLQINLTSHLKHNGKTYKHQILIFGLEILSTNENHFSLE
uniref:SF3 helicase domain-containing protein n=1 Tax=Ignavibacterium album TaxID=591197 RepID=A0A7V3E794_9BACT